MKRSEAIEKVLAKVYANEVTLEQAMKLLWTYARLASLDVMAEHVRAETLEVKREAQE